MKRSRSRHLVYVPAFVLLVVSGCSSSDDASGETKSSKPKHSGSAGKASAGDAAAADSDAAASSDTAEVPKDLIVTGPITGGKGKAFTASAADLAGYGYTEKEFFFEGGASAYDVEGEMAMDGKWKLKERSRAAFKSRLLVRRPKDASKFNGTVVVEWLNVSGGADGDPGFMYNSDLILREGFAFVAVSAQVVGVEPGNGMGLAGPAATPLKVYDPDRYGSLKHPGDAYSYDIYSQAAEAIRSPKKVDVLEGLKPERLIAYGESQSAGRLVSYVNGVHPLVKRYDGFFIHSRGASGPSFGDGTTMLAMGLPRGSPVSIRDDIDEKVFQFQTETDVTGALGFLPARQPDSDKLRTWEVAGTSHADQYIIDFNSSLMNPGAFGCEGANTGPQFRVIRAALHSLNAWMSDGTEPSKGALLATDADGKPMRDEHGNSFGGVRSPDVDVPTKTLTGDPAPNAGMGNFFCSIFGSTTPFTPDELMKLYPTHDEYVMKVKEAASKARDAGFLLEPEEKGFATDAEKAAVPN